uniref:ATP synthase subunit 6 n=1 Tax=Ammopiptanthus mongolicus TaxID=126911 RepID=A0A385G295_AMMMO|nr:ATP synthase subunit 6 [Ammopiptanthus mongolicus]AXV54316.1 ATP synthase subunit 6 [Ammopiptanthus mongolicus]
MNQSKQMKLFHRLKNCFRRSKEEDKEKRSPYANEDVAKVPKIKMMERIAEVVKAAQSEKEEKKGRDEGSSTGEGGPKSPLDQFAIHPLIDMKIGGNLVPNAWQSLVELLYDFVLNLVNEQIGYDTL